MSSSAGRPALTRLRIAGSPEPWGALGFTITDGRLVLGKVEVELIPASSGQRGIVGWTLHGIQPVASIDGLPTEVTASPPALAPSQHDNGAVGIDHVVVTTPNFERTSLALADVGLELRRVREAPGGIRQGFRRLAQTILELVEIPDSPDPDGPARFWGLVVVVPDLEALSGRLGEHLAPAKDAVQPGRRIATLRASGGLGPAVAFMTPDVRE